MMFKERSKKTVFLWFSLLLGILFFVMPSSAYYQEAEVAGEPAPGTVYEGLDGNDLNTLLAIYQQMTPEGQNNSGWFKDNLSPCTWNGISCENGFVTRIEFNSADFFCFIPKEITNLPELQELKLVNLGLRGTLPENLFSMRKLRIIEISGNLLTGPIPAVDGSLFGQLPLETLILEDNRWNDAKQQNLNNRPNLSLCTSVVALSDIDAEPGLDGTIPATIANLTSLSKLDLSGNNLTGEIPAELETLGGISSVDLSDNNPQNPLVINSPSLVQRFSSLPEQNLSGVVLPQPTEAPVVEIPTEVPTEAPLVEPPTEIPVIEVPVIEVPTEIPFIEVPTAVPFIEIPMEVSTEVPSVELPTEIPFIEIPTENPVIEIPTVEIPTESPIIEFPTEIPPEEPTATIEILPTPEKVSESELITLYAIFAKMTPFGQLNSGWFMSEASCHWNGITCENGRITELKFDSVDYFCTIPEEIAALPNLRVLHLNNLGLHGTIPAGLFGMPELNELVIANNLLSGTIPEVDPAVAGQSPLQRLVIAGNQLTPEKEAELAARGNLQVCQPSVQELSQQTASAETQLSGVIPDSIGLLFNLQSLDLSGNLLEGEVPVSLGQLNALSSINLSNNSTLNPLTITDQSLAAKLLSLPSYDLSGVSVLPPTETPVPTETETVIPPTETAVPTETETVVLPTETPVPTETETMIPPTETPIPAETETVIPPTETPVIPTSTAVPPTATQVIIPTGTLTNTPLPPTATLIPPVIATNTPQPTGPIIVIIVTATPQPVWYTSTPIRWVTSTPLPWVQPPIWTYKTATPVPYRPPVWVYPTSSWNNSYPVATAYVPQATNTPLPTVNPAAQFEFNYVTEKMTSDKIPVTWKYTGMKEYMINYLDSKRALYPGFGMEWTAATKVCTSVICQYDVTNVPEKLLDEGSFYIQLQAKDAAGKIYQSDPIGFQIAGNPTPTVTPTSMPEERRGIGGFFSRLFRFIFGPIIRLFGGS